MKLSPYLSTINLIKLFRHSNEHITRIPLDENGMSVSNRTDLLFSASVAGLIGLTVGFVISLAISINRHWLWLNSMIALLIMIIPIKPGFLKWNYLREIFWGP